MTVDHKILKILIIQYFAEISFCPALLFNLDVFLIGTFANFAPQNNVTPAFSKSYVQIELTLCVALAISCLRSSGDYFKVTKPLKKLFSQTVLWRVLFWAYHR